MYEEKKRNRSALVLGAAGPLAVAWETGILAGLTSSCPQLLEPDRIIGTSAGAVLGSQLSLGYSSQSLYKGELERGEVAGRRFKEGGFSDPHLPEQLPPMVNELLKAVSQGDVPEELLVDVAKHAQNHTALTPEQLLSYFTCFITPIDEWPDNFTCTAVNARTGSLEAWDNSSGVNLMQAVSASCCSPLTARPIEIDGHLYMDGALKSTTNSELAAGYDTVVIIAPMAAFFPEAVRNQTLREIPVIEKAGGKAVLITPDTVSRQSMGTNPFDLSHVVAAAEAGMAQSKSAPLHVDSLFSRFGRR